MNRKLELAASNQSFLSYLNQNSSIQILKSTVQNSTYLFDY